MFVVSLLATLVAVFVAVYIVAVAYGLESPVRLCYAVVTCPPAFAAVLAAPVVLGALTHPAACAAAAAPLLFGVQLILPTPRLPRLHPAGGSTLRLVAVNVLYSNTRIDELAELVAHTDPDVVVACEVLELFDELAAGLAPLVPVASGGPSTASSDDIVIFARPGLAAPAEPLEAAGRSFPSVIVTDGRGTLRVVGVHTSAPGAGTPPAHWRAQLAALAGLLTSSTSPVVAAGDFNASLLHAPLSRFRRPARWWFPTWPARLPLLELDQVLTAKCAVSSLRRFRAPGSDHRGLIAEIARPGDTPVPA